MTELVRRYLRLGLRFGRLGDGLVESYTGPRELADAVRAEPTPTPRAVMAEAEALLADLPDGWLRDQVGGLHAYTAAMTGATRSFVDEVQGCYGVRVTFTDEAVFEAAHRRLSELLPGPQPLVERYRRWRRSTHVPPERIRPLVEDAVALGRAWTERLIALPQGESLDVDIVSGRPWSGYHEYLGDFRGRVRINTDTPRTVAGLLRLVLHETYPGHQAEAALKEESLVQRKHQLEQTLALTPTPQTLISEGLAEVAPDLVLDSPDAQALAADLDTDLAHARAVDDAAAPLRWAEVNAAMLAFDPASSTSDVRDYLRRWRLIEENAAAELLRFLEQPATRTYIAVYPAGRERCETFVNGDPHQFRKLLTDQIRVSDLPKAS